jgi:hypothetical protein
MEDVVKLRLLFARIKVTVTSIVCARTDHKGPEKEREKE